MNMAVSFHGFSRAGQSRLREIFAAYGSRLDRRLKAFTPNVVRLEGRIEKNPSHHLYCVSLRLKLPGCVLAAAAEDYDLKAVLSEVFDELERRVDRHLAQRRSAYLGRRAASQTPDTSRAQRPQSMRTKVSGGLNASL